jgi:DNA-binding PadR family transcriptional regulator
LNVEVSRDVAGGHLDLLLLAAVRQQPAHGYLIIEELRRKTGGAFDFTEGTVYPTLHRLEQDGLVASGWSSASGRRRRVYRITRAGRARLGEREQAWRAFRAAIDAAIG